LGRRPRLPAFLALWPGGGLVRSVTLLRPGRFQRLSLDAARSGLSGPDLVLSAERDVLRRAFWSDRLFPRSASLDRRGCGALLVCRVALCAQPEPRRQSADPCPGLAGGRHVPDGGTGLIL